ncbi:MULTISPECIES: hypothetical protein [unclassified Nostoc]|nr:hypothetical protein [Nostoc sp. JL31]
MQTETENYLTRSNYFNQLLLIAVLLMVIDEFNLQTLLNQALG